VTPQESACDDVQDKVTLVFSTTFTGPSELFALRSAFGGVGGATGLGIVMEMLFEYPE
jgi:hypothetical protein